MTLTITELAQAVGKSDNYVRQHIRRKHLIVQRRGRSVSVALDEAARWARDRRLPFTPPVHAVALTGSSKRRTARMTVLTALRDDSKARNNMFTLIRHRREDSLGPWATGSGGAWVHTDLRTGLRLYTLDASSEHCNCLIEQILNCGTLTIDGIEILYALEPVPRCHWAYRDHRSTDASVCSPFSSHSAEITEYWSFDKSLRNLWTEVGRALPGKPPGQINRLGFPLDQRSDRIGNLMIANALDAFTCELTHRYQTLKLDVQGDRLLSTHYRAVVWASHSEDTVLRREVPAKSTSIKLASDVDHIGFSIYRTEDGQCVDHMESHLIKSISARMHFADQPTITIQGRRKRTIQEVTPSGTMSTISVDDEQISPDFDKRIRCEWLGRQLRDRDNRARKDGLVRFRYTESEAAISHFIGLLNAHSDNGTPIYLADPYFMADSMRDEVRRRLLIQVFAVTRNHQLRILCGQFNDDYRPPWWSAYPIPTTHVRTRAFLDKDNRPVFHDRYLITSECETLITNSLNGWHKDGVTFSRNSYEVYHAEAENLWSMDIESSGAELRVKEIS